MLKNLIRKLSCKMEDALLSMISVPIMSCIIMKNDGDMFIGIILLVATACYTFVLCGIYGLLRFISDKLS